MSEVSRMQQDQARAIPMDQIQTELLAALETTDESGVADGVDMLISQGAYHGCSDIHLEPWSDYLSLRYRIDGILHQCAFIPKEFQPKINARIKVLADLVVYRKDVPQDGRIDFEKTTCGRPLRVSTVPTIKGEKTVIRLLGDTVDLYTLKTLGFQPHVVDTLRDIITRTSGTLMLTGPSSAGKTTTIYAILREMMDLQKNTTNIVTIEDPVEYTMDHISQIQTNPHVDFTFATALRAILRQDPEIIMVGEIRDLETARMAIRAGLTGHFVISTIHSGTSAGVFTRLVDMGIEPFLVASSVTAVLAQRLVRLNCTECAAAYTPDPGMRARFSGAKKKVKFFRGVGCEACNGIGYRGRATIGELFTVDQELAEAILERPTTSRLEELAISKGMETITQDGYAKATKGITTLEELIRVLPSILD